MNGTDAEARIRLEEAVSLAEKQEKDALSVLKTSPWEDISQVFLVLAALGGVIAVGIGISNNNPIAPLAVLPLLLLGWYSRSEHQARDQQVDLSRERVSRARVALRVFDASSQGGA